MNSPPEAAVLTFNDEDAEPLISMSPLTSSCDVGAPVRVEIPPILTFPYTPKILLKGKKAFPALEPLGFYLFVKLNHMKKQYRINKIKKKSN